MPKAGFNEREQPTVPPQGILKIFRLEIMIISSEGPFAKMRDNIGQFFWRRRRGVGQFELVTFNKKSWFHERNAGFRLFKHTQQVEI